MGRIFKDDRGASSARPLSGGGRRRRSSRPGKRAPLACCLLVVGLILFGDPLPAARAQSGRRQPTEKPAPVPHGEPIVPPRQTPQFSDKQKNDDRNSPPAASPDEDDGGDVVRVNSTLVPLQASVVGPDGRAVVDLKLEDFALTVDGEAKPLTELSRAELPVQMTLLFDNSSSLNPAREFQKKAAVRFFRRVLRPVDQAAIYSISTAPELIQPLTGDVKLLTRVIDNFGKPKGATALLDTVVEAAEYLRIRQGRKVIVIVSDGADTVSERDFDSTLRAVQAANCQVYAVQTGQYENANLRDLTAERRLQQLAAQTGGAMYVPLQTPDLNEAFNQISADLAQQYILSYYPGDEKRDGRFHTVDLRVRTRERLRVRTRRGYYAPKKSDK